MEQGVEQQYQNYFQQMEAEISSAKASQAQMAKAQVSMYSAEEQENLIRWQLDLREDLDRIYHLLKGDILTPDAHGSLQWTDNPDSTRKPFNDYGVQLIMNIMSFYLNRNTILSNYDAPTIKWKVLDFSYDLSDLIFNKYEEMGMDTPDKLKLYPMICRELVDTVHSAYLRAYNGGERTSLKEARVVTQNDSMNAMQNMPNMQKKKKTWNPFTWF